VGENKEVEEMFGRLFSENLSRTQIQDIVNNPCDYSQEYYCKVFQLALAKGITKETK
jgi:hypothetical protein